LSGFEPEAFFQLAALKWVQGDPQTALEKLKRGGAVIVAREFLVAQGLGVGQVFTCSQEGKEHRFEIVGVVSSPGLEIVSKFFNVGEDYTDQALHAVFGSREDLKNKFFGGEPAPIQLIQIQFADSVGSGQDDAALEKIRGALMGAGILDVGSGRQIKEEITRFATGTLLAISAVAFTAMLVACFGVANLIIAGIEARQFEFGVLRAVGAQRSLLTRLVLGEALIVGVTAVILGTLMGIQGSWAGQRLHAALLGISLNLRPPIVPIAAGWIITIALTLLAAWPAIWRLGKRGPRDLLATTKG
jgi:putative ABC transport system permease protein